MARHRTEVLGTGHDPRSANTWIDSKLPSSDGTWITASETAEEPKHRLGIDRTDALINLRFLPIVLDIRGGTLTKVLESAFENYTKEYYAVSNSEIPPLQAALTIIKEFSPELYRITMIFLNSEKAGFNGLPDFRRYLAEDDNWETLGLVKADEWIFVILTGNLKTKYNKDLDHFLNQKEELYAIELTCIKGFYKTLWVGSGIYIGSDRRTLLRTVDPSTHDTIYIPSEEKFQAGLSVIDGELKLTLISGKCTVVRNREKTELQENQSIQLYEGSRFQLGDQKFRVDTAVKVIDQKAYLSTIYADVKKLRSGGQGAVYTGKHIKLGRTEAIKVILDRWLTDSRVKARMINEAKVLANIDNPHIVFCYEGNFDHGNYYFSMEYIEGETLRDYLTHHKKVNFLVAVYFLLQIMDALIALHKQGVVHKDLKPDNVMLDKRFFSFRSHFFKRKIKINFLKLIDFGLIDPSAYVQPDSHEVRLHDIKDPKDTTSGTPHYMSPESLRGKSNFKTDIWALGVVAYEMIAGRPPFPEEEFAPLVQHIATKDPVNIRKHRPDIPEPFASLIHQMLNKDMRQRPKDEYVWDQLWDIRNCILMDRFGADNYEKVFHKHNSEAKHKLFINPVKLTVPRDASEGDSDFII